MNPSTLVALEIGHRSIRVFRSSLVFISNKDLDRWNQTSRVGFLKFFPKLIKSLANFSIWIFLEKRMIYFHKHV